MHTLARSLALVALTFLIPALAHAGTLSISTLNLGSSVQPGTQVSFVMVPSGFGSALTYSVADSFSGTTITNSNFNTSGAFSWVPRPSDSGVHNLTVTGVDQSGSYNLAYLQLTIAGDPTITIQSLSTSTIRVGQQLTFTASTFNLTSPTYSVVDLNPASTIVSSSMSAGGAFSWTPTIADLGMHPLTIRAQESGGRTVSTILNIDVMPEAYLTLVSRSGATVYPGQVVSVVVAPFGFTSPNFSLADSKQGTTLTSAHINSAGILMWTPTAADVGGHLITISASDLQGRIARLDVPLTVQSSSQPPIVTPPILTPPTNVSYKFYYSLDVGSRGADVTALQQRLLIEGVYAGPVTGYFGLMTQAGVRAYQAKYGIDQVGRVGPQTRAALNAL